MTGFDLLSLSTFNVGGNLALAEPLVGIDENLYSIKRVIDAVNLPLLIEAETSTSPLHIVQTVKKFEAVGVAGIILSDQVYPKRAHHRDREASVISSEEMERKIRTARKVSDGGPVVMAVTNTLRSHGFDEAAERLNRYAEAGAEVLCTYFLTRKEAQALPRLVKAPLMMINSESRAGEPLYAKEAEEMGFKILLDSASALLASFAAVKSVYEKLKETGRTELFDSRSKAIEVRKLLDDLTGLPEIYKIEDAYSGRGV